MAGAEKIINKIIEDANTQAKKNIDKAENEAINILKMAEQECTEKAEAILQKADLESANVIKRMIAVAQLEGRKKKLGQKQCMIEKAFSSALNALIALPDTKYCELLQNLIVQAVVEGNEEIILSKSDNARIPKDFISKINDMVSKKGFAGKLTISKTEAAIKGGFILKRGSIEINNSLEIMLKIMKDQLEPEVVKILFS